MQQLFGKQWFCVGHTAEVKLKEKRNFKRMDNFYYDVELPKPGDTKVKTTFFPLRVCFVDGN